ncbi:PAP2-like haloperoxidase [Gracilaria domingensis]|nr:PAP2-like haloperoxidase [Gracilaria domingensis]KAI0556622.1 PAP2-like haloperoxidase [Gracilaria domingensis]KAI0556704.1 PAP2-like haloperoxidase [Gracilaria domingensis]
MSGYADFLRRLNLEPVSPSRDPSTLNGWANRAGDRLANFFQNDGWNSLGDRSRQTGRVPFEDFTGYRPVNSPYDEPFRLARPLRWVPDQLDLGNARLAHQIHVVPQIARAVDPLIVPAAEAAKRRVSPPFRRPNARKISYRDRRVAERLVNQVLETAATVTPQQRFYARWWDNKLLSTGGISGFYETAAQLTPFQVAQQFLGEMLSQHDALVLTWREKRRHDLVRPGTLIRNLRRNQRFNSFISEEVGFGQVRAEDWRSLISAQPHSEFPSGSAALCTAAMEHIETYVRNKMGFVPSIKIRYAAGSLPFFLPQDTTVAFGSPLQAAANCAQSRLWAGVHFPPALPAGERIGRGIGRIVFQHMKTLGEGRVPNNCTRCLSEGILGR